MRWLKGAAGLVLVGAVVYFGAAGRPPVWVPPLVMAFTVAYVAERWPLWRLEMRNQPASTTAWRMGTVVFAQLAVVGVFFLLGRGAGDLAGLQGRSHGPADAYLLAMIALLAVLPFFVPELRAAAASPEALIRLRAILADLEKGGPAKAHGTAPADAAPVGGDTSCECSRECFEVGGLDLGLAAGSSTDLEDGKLHFALRSERPFVREGRDEVAGFRVYGLVFPTPALERRLTLPGATNAPSVAEDGFGFGTCFRGEIRVGNGWVCLRGSVGPGPAWGTGASVGVHVCKAVSLDGKADPAHYEYSSVAEIEATGAAHVIRASIDLGTAEELPRALADLPNLRTLRLTAGRLPAGLGRLGSLKELTLHGKKADAFNELPADLRELRSLKELSINEGITRVPTLVTQLTGLRRLSLAWNALAEVPSELAQLARLESLSLRSCRLRTLPEAIGEVPSLKRLELRHNPFEALPASLCNIPEVDIEHRHRALFSDISYRSSSAAPIRPELFAAANDPDLRAQIEAASAGPLARYAGGMLAEARRALALETAVPDAGERVGGTRLGGVPDLPAGTAWPQTDGRHWSFMAQIDLEELAPLQDYLPRQGVLAFFCADPIQDLGSLRVFHFTPADGPLRRAPLPSGAEFIDEVCEGRPYPGFHARARKVASLPWLYSDEHRLTAAGRVLLEIPEARGGDLSDAWSTLRDRLAGASGYGHHGVNCHVFTQHESPEEQAAEAKGGTHDEWMVLLTLGSEGKLGFQFGDAGTLTFCIHKKDLAVADFASVVLSTESS